MVLGRGTSPADAVPDTLHLSTRRIRLCWEATGAPPWIIRCSTSNVRHCRVNSSTTVYILSFLPVSVRSSTKSYAHTCPGYSARHGIPTPIPRRLRQRFCASSNPCLRHSRRTRLRFTCRPSRRSITHSRCAPKRGCSLASSIRRSTSSRSFRLETYARRRRLMFSSSHARAVDISRTRHTVTSLRRSARSGVFFR